MLLSSQVDHLIAHLWPCPFQHWLPKLAPNGWELKLCPLKGGAPASRSCVSIEPQAQAFPGAPAGAVCVLAFPSCCRAVPSRQVPTIKALKGFPSGLFIVWVDSYFD